MAGTRTFPVRRQNRTTRRSVLLLDRLANWTITIGGLLVIVAVAAIMVFLAQVVVPLFTGARILAYDGYQVALPSDVIVMAGADEYRTIGIALTRSGQISTWHLPTGTPLADQRFDMAGGAVTAYARGSGGHIGFGFADGTVRFANVAFVPTILSSTSVPHDVRRLNNRDSADGRSVYSRISADEARRIDVVPRLEAPQQIAPASTPVVALDYRRGGTVERPTLSFVTADASGVLRLSRAEGRMNIMTRQMRTTVETAELPRLPDGVRLTSLLMTEKADQVLVGTEGGEVFRYDTRDFRMPRLAERARLTSGAEALTGLSFLIGEQSLIATGSSGMVDVFFALPGAKDTADGTSLVRAHVLERQEAAIDATAVSQRGKMFLTADVSGAIWLRHSTSRQTLLRMRKPAGVDHFAAIALTPRDDGVLAIAADGRASFWQISAPHPETTLRTIFGKVWYEGYPQPTFTWQSSAGNDLFEPKLSLVPLIFGTLKATTYAMLFAAPIALLAAIYTSEFLHRRVRAVVKPAMEMMASLPSVVLGFIAALILAPIVETLVTAVLLAMLLVPLAWMAAAHVWQLLPQHTALRLDGMPRFILMFVVLALGIALSATLAPLTERLMFGGDIKSWLNHDNGGAWGFLTFILIPLGTLLAVWLSHRVLGAGIEAAVGVAPRGRVALLAALRWILTIAAGFGLSAAIAWLLTVAGLDPRDGLVGTYVQRNTLIVGFAMGFAVIPIIYTISEDALNAVPTHLRTASLACGATTWQTASRIVLPTAASGVFAAVMIGMGRAVGETMIVVMAAGNTPLMDWNIFNGLRALSANIAVELPEAVRDGTLYRMLFLAALTLFVMTFFVNTVAEITRLRFRRRAASL